MQQTHTRTYRLQNEQKQNLFIFLNLCFALEDLEQVVYVRL